MADGSLPIVVTPEAFGRGAFDLAVVEGLTVRGMLVEAIKSGLPIGSLDRTEIYVDGVRLPRDMALDHVLKRGQIVNVVVEPLGGGGGRKDIGQILLTVAIIVVSAWIGGPTGPLKAWPLIARVAAATAVQVLGSMAMNALYAPDTKAQAKANDRYALQSASNQYRQWGSMPLALGEVVAAPDLAAKTFTQSSGEDVWLYGILGIHYGPCEVSELKIGDTLASTMGPGDFRMVQHLTPGPRAFQLYPNDVDQLDLQEELQATQYSQTPLVRAASSDGSRFDIDFFLPGGLYFQKDDGRILTARVSVAVRYRPIDASGAATGPWQSGPTLSRASTTKDPMRITHSVSLPHGRYEFELTRNRPDDNNDKRRDDIYVTAIKSVAFRKPITDETLSIIEFAVRATAINQGGLAPITCRIKPLCQTWTGTTWGAPVATSNPAALARWLLTGPAPAKPIPTSQADVRLRAWSALCEQYNWSSHVYLTETKTQAEALQILERAGRASLFWDGSQVASSPWVEKPAPRQLFTGANLRDHRWEIVYPEPVHALRVEFQNFDKAGEPDELFVYADGYGETADPAKGIQAATLIEALRLDGQATPNRAFRDGRWALGQRLHQRRVETWTADIENLISQYGDRVRLAWRRVDGAEARVRCRRWTGGLVSGLRLTSPVEMVEGVDYAVDLRTVNGLFAAVPVQTRPGVSREIIFATPRGPDVCPSADDLVAFGVATRVSEDVEIIGIEPGENLSAVLTGIRYVAPLLMAGETGPIPPLQSRLTGERAANPPRPTLLGVQQDANGVRLSFDLPTWRGSPISGFTVRWRSKAESGETSTWSALPALDGAARELRTPPLREAPVDVAGVEATRVEIEVTATTVDGRASLPLIATVVMPTPSQPLSSVWNVTAKAAAADGTSQPILIVTGEVNDPNVAAVLIQWGLTAEGPWNDAYQGAPLTKALEISGLTAGVEHFVAITHLSAQGVPSQFLVIGPRVPGALRAEDVVAVNGVPADTLTENLADAVQLGAETKTRVDSLTEVVESATGEFSQALILVGEQVEAANDAASAASGSATSAANSEGGALAYRNQASEARDDAVSARDETRTSASTAQAAKAAMLPPRLDTDGSNFTTNANGAATVGGLPASRTETVAGFGLVGIAADGATIYQRAPMAFRTGRVYRVRARVELVAPSSQNARIYLRGTDSDYVTTSSPTSAFVSLTPGVVTEVSLIYGNPRPSAGDALMGAGSVWVRAGVQSQGPVPGGSFRVYEIYHEDITESSAAAGYAASALSQSSSASASAAEASISASIAASVGNAGQNLVPNSTGLAGVQLWEQATAQVISADPTAIDGARFIWFPPAAGSYNARRQSEPIPYGPGSQTSLSAEVFAGRLQSGAIRVYIQYLDAAGGHLGFLVAEAYGDTNGWIKIKKDGKDNPPSPAGTHHIRVNMDTYLAQWTLPNPVAAWRKIKVENGPVATPWNDYANDRMVSAQLAITAKTTAGSTGQVLVDVTGGAGGDPFNIELKAGPGASSAGLTATKISLKNIINGNIVDALDIQGGNAVLRGNLTAGGGIYLGSGTVWAVALRPQTFTRGDGETISFGGANIGIPTYEFMRDNLLPLAAGESYDLQIKNLTAAGGTVWAKISIPGTPSAQTLAGPGTAPGSGPTRQNVKTPKPDSVNGNYTITLSGTYAFTIFKNTNFQDYEGSVTVGVFVRKSGVWSRVGALTASWYTTADNPSSVNRVEIVPWMVTDTVQMGDSIEAFGATIESSSGPFAGRSVGLHSLGPIDWSSQGSASGTKSALASGAKTSIKITPQG